MILELTTISSVTNFWNHEDLFLLQKKKEAFLNHSSQNDPVGLGILPNEFLMLYYHDSDGRFIVANGNIVTSACLEYHEALETFSCRNSNTAFNGITPLQ